MGLAWGGAYDELLKSLQWCARAMFGGAAGGYVVKATFDPLSTGTMVALALLLIIGLVAIDLFIKFVGSRPTR